MILMYVIQNKQVEVEVDSAGGTFALVLDVVIWVSPITP